MVNMITVHIVLKRCQSYLNIFPFMIGSPTASVVIFIMRCELIIVGIIGKKRTTKQSEGISPSTTSVDMWGSKFIPEDGSGNYSD